MDRPERLREARGKREGLLLPGLLSPAALLALPTEGGEEGDVARRCASSPCCCCWCDEEEEEEEGGEEEEEAGA